MQLSPNVYLHEISRPSLNLGYVRSETRSQGQILEESCVHNRGFIFHRIFMKLCLNVCLKTIYVKLKYGSCGFEN